MFKRIAAITITVTVALAAAAGANPMDTLQSDASTEEKAEACRLLSISGDVSAIPVLESLLTDEHLSHMARYALEPMPGTEADAALRRALKVVSGRLKAGVIASLGVRRDARAVPEIIPLLNDENGFVVEAAARALGRIGAPEGVDALETFMKQPGHSYAIMQAVGDGLFAAAENAVAAGRRAEAVRFYDAIYAAEAMPVASRAAALRGAMLARESEDGQSLLLKTLEDENTAFFKIALRAAQEMDNENTAAEVARLLPNLPSDRKIQVIQLLGELGRSAAAPALMREAEKGETPARVAALAAVTRLAYAPAVPLLTALVLSEDADLANAARKGLAYFPGEKGDDAIRDMLKNDDAQTRRIAVELVNEGALPEPIDLLMRAAKDDADESVRLAALKGAKDYAGPPQMSGLLDHLLSPRSEAEMIAAEEALKVFWLRRRDASEAMPHADMKALCDALAVTDGETRLAVMRVLTAIGSRQAFDAIMNLAENSGGDVKEAALRALCDWPAPLALPTLIDWVKAPPADKIKPLALRSAVRLLMLGQDTPEAISQHYAALLGQAASPNEKKLILSGLANVGHASALLMALEQLEDESVKAEAVQAAIAIAEKLGDSQQDIEALEKAGAMIPQLRGGERK